MPDATFDLFKGTSQENAVWVETVEGLQPAMDRMNRLAAASSSACFLFRQGNVVASATNPNERQPDTPPSWKIIVLSSNPNQISALTDILKRQNVEPTCASTVCQYREIISKQPIGLVFCDPKLSDGDYREVIRVARSMGSRARIVVASRLASRPDFLEAMRAGAFDVISAPCRPKDVEWMIIQAKRDERRAAKLPLAAEEIIRARRATA